MSNEYPQQDRDEEEKFIRQEIEEENKRNGVVCEEEQRHLDNSWMLEAKVF